MYCPRSRLYRRLYDGYTLRCKYKGHTNRNTQVGVPPGWQGNGCLPTFHQLHQAIEPAPQVVPPALILLLVRVHCRRGDSALGEASSGVSRGARCKACPQRRLYTLCAQCLGLSAVLPSFAVV